MPDALTRAAPETVARHMVGPARAEASDSVAEVLGRMREHPPQCLDPVCVVQHDGKLAGVLPLAALVSAPATARMHELVRPGFPTVTPETDQEAAANLALHHGVDSLPVVDARGVLVGVMPSQALLHVLRREHVEDLHLLAGIQREAAVARQAIEDPPARRARHRLPWLLAGLAGATLATTAMAAFEATLQAKVAVAFFVPGLVYLADAIGTQSGAIAVRGLSLTRSGIAPLIAGEMRTGLLLGAVLGALCFVPVWLAFGDARLAGAVSTAILAAGGVASVLGLALPWLLAQLGYDPAYGSGPVATAIQDLISLLLYFGIVRAFGA